MQRLGSALRSIYTIAVCSLPIAAGAQTIPIRELAAPNARTTESFGNIFGVRPLSGGKVLVNDGVRRQLIILDEKFATRTIAIDSVTTGGQSYGPRASPLIPYLADSTFFVDGASLTLLVIDPNGKIARVMSAPKPGDVSALASGASGVDAKGNLVYRGRSPATPTPAAGSAASAAQASDSQPIVRADFDTRQVDTLGRVKVRSGGRTVVSQDPNGKTIAVTTVNPLSTVDEWGVMSDGTVAFVRGQDYHIDFLAPDGKAYASAKLPFDWKRLTDEDKQALVDSARNAINKAVSDARAKAANPAEADRAASIATMMALASAMGMSSGGGMGGGMGGGTVGGAAPMGPMPAMPTMVTEFVPLKEITDYYPAIRAGAVKADLDGNLWILPTSSAQSKAGELIYDIVNKQGVLTQRVRVPLGRSIAGFGHKGIVYLMQRDANGAWFLERTRIVGVTTQ
ncbi:MAG: hypothetical protein ABI852_04200 [Gemmatimonadaceae bacterium]